VVTSSKSSPSSTQKLSLSINVPIKRIQIFFQKNQICFGEHPPVFTTIVLKRFYLGFVGHFQGFFPPRFHLPRPAAGIARIGLPPRAEEGAQMGEPDLRSPRPWFFDSLKNWGISSHPEWGYNMDININNITKYTGNFSNKV